jgi:hypothetical protein
MVKYPFVLRRKRGCIALATGYWKLCCVPVTKSRRLLGISIHQIYSYISILGYNQLLVKIFVRVIYFLYFLLWKILQDATNVGSVLLSRIRVERSFDPFFHYFL